MHFEQTYIVNPFFINNFEFERFLCWQRYEVNTINYRVIESITRFRSHICPLTQHTFNSENEHCTTKSFGIHICSRNVRLSSDTFFLQSVHICGGNSHLFFSSTNANVRLFIEFVYKGEKFGNDIRCQ